MKRTLKKFKLWKGIEKEGKQIGIMALFVYADTLNKNEYNIIRNILKEHKDIKRIYFNAGEYNTTYSSSFEKFAKELKKDYELAIEMDVMKFNEHPLKFYNLFDDVIIRIITSDKDKKNENYMLYSNCQIKFRNKYSLIVGETYNYMQENMNNVSNDKYKTDEVLYE